MNLCKTRDFNIFVGLLLPDVVRSGCVRLLKRIPTSIDMRALLCDPSERSGVCSKITEPNWLGSAGGIPPTSPFARLALKRKRKGRFQAFLWRQIL